MKTTIAFVALTVGLGGAAQTQTVSSLSSPVTQDQLNALSAQNLAIMAATTPQFVGGSSAYQTLAQLNAAYPCNTTNLGKLANVSDVYGAYAKRLVCETDTTSGLFYWYPETPDASIAISQTSGTVPVTTLGTPPAIYFQSTPSASINVVFQTPCAPGEVKRIYAPATLGLGSINLTGIIGGGTVPLLQGADKVVTCINGTAWKSN